MIGAIDPARGVHADILEHALHAVFVLQAKCNDLELQLSDRPEDQLVVAQGSKELCRPLLAQLSEPLRSAFIFRGSLSTARRNSSGAKLGIPVKDSRSPVGEGIADVDRAVIVQPDDVPGVGLLGLGAVGRHEGERIGNPDFLAEPGVIEPHSARVTPRAKPHEGDAIAMSRVHVGLNLEDEPRKRVLERLDLALASHARQRSGRIAWQRHAAAPPRRSC